RPRAGRQLLARPAPPDGAHLAAALGPGRSGGGSGRPARGRADRGTGRGAGRRPAPEHTDSAGQTPPRPPHPPPRVLWNSSIVAPLAAGDGPLADRAGPDPGMSQGIRSARPSARPLAQFEEQSDPHSRLSADVPGFDRTQGSYAEPVTASHRRWFHITACSFGSFERSGGRDVVFGDSRAAGASRVRPPGGHSHMLVL